MKNRYLFLGVFATLLFSSCVTIHPDRVIVPNATVPPAMTAAKTPLPAAVPQVPPAPVRSDAKHVVAPGETLGMLGDMYDVPAAAIAAANHLKKKAVLRPGVTLLIPQASPFRSVITLFHNKKWKYIIIHHSATARGDSLAFNGAHLQRGFKGGVGYDFVIDNGTLGKEDGEIEATPRWLKQQDGRHCKASQMNHKAIGICLVGNLNQEKVTERQMASLVYLVNTLRHYYKIPVKKIMGHGQVPGADTDCPGKKFPWDRFFKGLGE